MKSYYLYVRSYYKSTLNRNTELKTNGKNRTTQFTEEKNSQQNYEYIAFPSLMTKKINFPPINQKRLKIGRVTGTIKGNKLGAPQWLSH